MASEEYSADGGTHDEAANALRLIDLRPGEHFHDVPCLLVEKQLRTSQNTGAPFLTMALRDSTAQVQAKWFKNFQEIEPQVQPGRVLRITGRVDNSERFRGNFVIDAAKLEETPTDLASFLPAPPAEHAAHRARFHDVIRSIHHKQLKALLKEIFDPNGKIWADFQIAPAAKGMHHAYIGGLLEHSGEVALLCDRVASTLPHLDRDLLVTAALLHDIGKLEEMESELGAVEYTAVGHLVGHVVLGTCTVASAAERVADFPPALKHELMHLILSHHGRPEFGAARHPMCAEAVVLSLCDLMSAKIAQCRDRAGADGSGEFADRKDSFGWESERIYLGAMKRMLADESNGAEGTSPAS
jgi:3'-5' exoribonuclease